MTMLALYKTKRELRDAVGQPLRYRETSLFGPEYSPDGWNTLARRPHLQGGGREWFARVLLRAGVIERVE